MVKKILVALDGSTASNNALSFALELADNLSADVELLTIVPPVFLPYVSAAICRKREGRKKVFCDIFPALYVKSLFFPVYSSISGPSSG